MNEEQITQNNLRGGYNNSSKTIKSYGFYPQMKAEGIAFKEELSVAVVVGTNPGFQMEVVIVESEKE